MEPLEKKLVLDREITRLSVTEKQLTAKVQRLSDEQLDLVDLKTKAQKEITELNEKKSRVLREISDEKTAWITQKAQEEEVLKLDKIETRKIINREEFVAGQEAKLRIEQERLNGVAQDLGQREKVLQEGLDFLSREKKQAENYVKEQERLVTELKQVQANLKAEFLNKLNSL